MRLVLVTSYILIMHFIAATTKEAQNIMLEAGINAQVLTIPINTHRVEQTGCELHCLLVGLF